MWWFIKDIIKYNIYSLEYFFNNGYYRIDGSIHFYYQNYMQTENYVFTIKARNKKSAIKKSYFKLLELFMNDFFINGMEIKDIKINDIYRTFNQW